MDWPATTLRLIRRTIPDGTPLSWAAGGGHEAVVKLLLGPNDAEVDSKDNFGGTPLLWVAGKGHEAIVKLLLAHNDVEVDSKDEKYVAVRGGREREQAGLKGARKRMGR